MARFDDLSEELVGEPRRWLVTGAAGFIGSALVEKLLDLGQTVVGLDNFATGHKSNLDDVLSMGEDQRAQFEFIEGDIRDLETCRRACDDVQYVLHQAALGSVPRSLEHPLDSHAANVDGFMNMLVAARDAGVARMVYASSSAVYGDHPKLPKREGEIGKPLSPYAATKLINEIYANVFHRNYGLSVVGLRYFNVFGRRQDPNGPYAAVIPRWIEALLNDQDCTIYGDGSHSRDFCYVDNVVAANLLAATHPDPAVGGAVFNVGCGDRTNLKQLYAAIAEAVAENNPSAEGREVQFAPTRDGDVPHSQADISAISNALGYEPLARIGEGMHDTVGWYVAKHERLSE